MQDQRITGFELSSVQEQLYSVSKGASQFQCQSAVLIDGRLDVARLRSSVDLVLTNYEVLRTNFRLLIGRRRLLQVVQPSPSTTLDVVDIPASGSISEKSQVEKLLRDLREEPFDLESGALAKFKLLHLSDRRNVLVLTVSSLCADAASAVLIVDDILNSYQGTASADAEPLQYADFSAWQRDLQQSDEPEAQLGRDYWSAQEETAVSLQTLPYENGEPGLNLDPASVPVPFSAPLTSILTNKYNDGKPEAEDFLLACWIALSQRLTHQDAGSVGRSVDGRTFEELTSAVGLFAKTIPASWFVDSSETIESLVAQAASAREESEPHQDYYVGQATSIDDPFIPALSFTWQPRFKGRTIGETSFLLYSQYNCTDAWALNLVCFIDGDNVAAEIQYDANRFNQDDMVRLADQFAILTESATVGSKPIGELALLPDAERQNLLVEWNRTEAAYPSDSAIHYLFEAQAVRTPGATALVCGDDRLTYYELNVKSNQIAHLLKSKGVGPNKPVVLCAERSADMIVGLLAVLKAGGYYVPLAADLPTARLEALLETCNASVVLTQSHLKDKFAGKTESIVSLDSDAATWSDLSAANPEHVNAPADLVYVIFTSGSTGVPKRVGNRHQGLTNYSSFIANKVGLTQAEGAQWHLGTVSTLNADLGNTSIFPSLAYGGCLHVIGYETAMDGELFAEYVAKNPLDLLKITPSHLRALLSATRSNVLPSKYLFLGGEALTWDLLSLARHRGTCTVINHYGPTETTIGSLTYDATAGSITAGDCATVPIGRPIANTQIYVLDELANPVPIGVSGELYIGGAGVASGYINQPEQTSERFIQNPFVTDANSLIYCTGDRVRYLAGGNIEFLGRMDDQIKIRGFRVEPGEVESVLRRHPSVASGVVLATEDNQGSKRLVSYYVASKTVTPEAVREYLTANLPEYMVPATITQLSEMALTPNGKIDRKALLSEEADTATPAYEAGRTPTEESLVEIWSQVLKQEKVGIHDDFFALGGHSLLMTQVLARIRNVFQVQLALHTLFDHPTIASLASVIDKEQTSVSSEEDEMRKLLAELEGLSDDEVEQLLSKEAVH